MNNTLNSQKGYVLPLTMMITTLLLAFVLHAVFLMQSDQHFFELYSASFHLQQIRESGLTEIDQKIRNQSLPANGQFVYQYGNVSFTTTNNGETLDIFLTVSFDGYKEKSKIIYNLASGQPIDWIERIEP